MPNAFLTFCYTGLSPKAPGTAGTLAATVLGVGIIYYVSMETLVLLTVLFTLMALKQIKSYEENGGMHDDSRIVIDEVVGVWIALILSSATWFQVLASFAFFRLYDIWKPSLIGRIDRNVKGGWGVMGDDMLAGVLAGISSAACYQLAARLI
jgi:phosphatidylglycerophosphatase A